MAIVLRPQISDVTSPYVLNDDDDCTADSDAAHHRVCVLHLLGTETVAERHEEASAACSSDRHRFQHLGKSTIISNFHRSFVTRDTLLSTVNHKFCV